MFKRSFFKTAVFIILAGILAYGLLPAGNAKADNINVINEDINKAIGDLRIPAGTEVNGSVTLNLGELWVEGTVNGNVANNLGQVNITGDVNGNVETNMGQVVVDGSVSGDVKTRMGEILITGSVGGNVNAGLGATTVEGIVGGNIDSGFGELVINGIVGGDIYSEGGNIVIGGTVEGNVHLERGVVELGPEAKVSGIVTVGRGLVKKDDSASTGSIRISEEVALSELEQDSRDRGYHFHGIERNLGGRIAAQVFSRINSIFGRFGFTFFPPGLAGLIESPASPFMSFYGNIARGILNMLILFALAALTYALFPKQVKAAGDAVTEKTGPVLGWGILAAVLAVPLMILLAITIIGIPLILVQIIVLTAAVLLGYTGIVDLVGRRIVKSASPAGSLGTIALGVLIIGLIAMIPVLGAIVSLAVFIIALGAALATRFGTSQKTVTVSSSIETDN